MEKLNLVAEVRSTTEKLSEVRAAKNIPAVIYGHNAENMIIKMNNSDFLRTFRKSGESHIISLEVAGKSHDVLVHDIQREPVSGDFLHIDFIFVIKGEKVHTNIPLSFIGESAAVKAGAILEEHLKDIEVKCLPADLVDAFEVNIAALVEMGSSIRVSDLGISDKYTVLTGSDDMVCAATQPAKMEVIEDAAPEAPVMEGDEEKA
jgi:large subunit ribosomal protein L25